jgi:hypothetical protein
METEPAGPPEGDAAGVGAGVGATPGLQMASSGLLAQMLD